MAAPIWRPFAPLKCKIFSWLAIKYRLWTSDRKACHGLPAQPDACATSLQEEDNVDHVLCLNHEGSDISKCQFYMDLLNECRRKSNSAAAVASPPVSTS
ncbi:hypothetical protein QYE76_027618 [Lolium multiflorum]|uniref:Reverse transcriptase zinc-binding domain-containing protein n=1 Tax=Lolium multiflorum TaxID=4521 RepID=A0AAD8QJF9_LOLMU|nr:hypothetical protein QYE76_027618 [Lolium multiflorum]